MSTTINFAKIIVTMTPLDSSIKPIQYMSDTIHDESVFLSEPQQARPRGRRFMGTDGKYSSTIHNYSSCGERDALLFDDGISDKLIGWAQQNPTVHFNYSFRYVRESKNVEDVRIQYHEDCFFVNTPAREMSGETPTIKFTINYAILKTLDGDGKPL